MPADSLNINTRAAAQNTCGAIVAGSAISGVWPAKELCEKGLKTLMPEHGHETNGPIRYKDIASWYDYAEPFVGISGSEECLPQLPDGKFLTAGNRGFGIGSRGGQLPYYENKVTLNKNKKDKWGLPTLDIDCGFKENEKAPRKDMMNSDAQMLEKAGIKKEICKL